LGFFPFNSGLFSKNGQLPLPIEQNNEGNREKSIVKKLLKKRKPIPLKSAFWKKVNRAI
jgi:hypothetical protein